MGDLLLEAYDQAFTNSITDILTVLEPLLAGQIEKEIPYQRKTNAQWSEITLKTLRAKMQKLIVSRI